MNNKPLLLAGCILCLGLASAAVMLFTSSDITKESRLFVMHGLKTGDFIRIEMASKSQYKTLTEATISNNEQIEIESSDALIPSDQYHIMITLIPQGESLGTDMSFVIDKKSGLIRASASGLPENVKSTLKVNGKIIEHYIPADWSGQVALRAIAVHQKGRSSEVCFNLYKYREKPISMCHDTLQKSQADMRHKTPLIKGSV